MFKYQNTSVWHDHILLSGLICCMTNRALSKLTIDMALSSK